METMVTARIDVSRPVGRKLVRELSGMRCVDISYPLIGKSDRTYSHAEIWEMGENILNEVFNTNDVKFS